MFAYKTAVAVRKKGFTNIKLFNGGLKDWIRSGHPIESIAPLPEYKGPVISAEKFMQNIKKAEETNCADADGAAVITLIDFRNLGALKQEAGGDRFQIKTSCPTLTFHLDDLLDNKTLINTIPRDSIVITISETGNRDVFLKRYLFSFGFTNITSLEYGMRAWLKAGYPSEEIPLFPLKRSE